MCECVCLGGYWCILALVLYVSTCVLTPPLGMDRCIYVYQQSVLSQQGWDIYICRQSVPTLLLFCTVTLHETVCFTVSVIHALNNVNIVSVGFLLLGSPIYNRCGWLGIKKQLVLSSAICGFEFGSFLPSMAERNQTFYAVKLHRLLCCPNISSPIQVTITTSAPEWRYMFWFTHQF